MNHLLKRVWGEAEAFFERSRTWGLVDAWILLVVMGLGYGFLRVAQEWSGVIHPAVTINLSPWALPKYAFFSLTRGVLAYFLSLGFSLVYGYWAAKDRRAEKLLIPLLDILQSIPVLGFMPGLVLALVALFPHRNLGIELASVLMIFTGQAWNMTFSFYHSLKLLPTDFHEVATVYRFSRWQCFKWVELPFASMGLVWNSMMSVAGGWFFLMVSETFVLGHKDFRLPGLGSYMSVAVAQGNIKAMLFAVLAMVSMIVLLDQLIWCPLVAWSQKFSAGDSAGITPVDSWVLLWFRRSRLLDGLRQWLARRSAVAQNKSASAPVKPRPALALKQLNLIPFVALLLLLAVATWGGWHLVGMLQTVSVGEWLEIFLAAVSTLARVLLSTLLATLWALPLGLVIGLNQRLAQRVQPLVQIAASFPAPMLFPAVVAILALAHVSLTWGSVTLMMLGTQWYIFFNVIAGGMAIPPDLREVARGYRVPLMRRCLQLYLPAVFPYLLTGWVAAAGGAWNTSIVAEYVSYHGRTLHTLGLGALISQAADQGQFAVLAASVMVMAIVVVTFNRTVWRYCYTLSNTRFSVNG